MALRRNQDLDAAGLKAYALRLLGARAMSFSELSGKLLRRAARPEDIDPLLGKLAEYGYIDDRRFAESYASARRDNEGFGRGRVLRDLRSRKVAPALAEKAVQQAYEGTDEDQLIEQFLARKFRRQPLRELLAAPKGLASAYRKLRHAGFSASASIRALRRYSELADALDGMESTDNEGPFDGEGPPAG